MECSQWITYWPPSRPQASLILRAPCSPASFIQSVSFTARCFMLHSSPLPHPFLHPRPRSPRASPINLAGANMTPTIFANNCLWSGCRSRRAPASSIHSVLGNSQGHVSMPNGLNSLPASIHRCWSGSGNLPITIHRTVTYNMATTPLTLT